ncbi:MAG: hypothetical protein MK202_06155 [Tenacibaculum sp.]|nr:hypothetical protein [Tenacibaculum sp.]
MYTFLCVFLSYTNYLKILFREKFNLPELENPVNSNFNEESATLNTFVATAAVSIGVWLIG